MSEYERFLAKLEPSLKRVKIVELTEKDVTFLAGETGADSRHIKFTILAFRYAAQTNLPPEVFYGWFRLGLPSELAVLTTLTTELPRGSLTVDIKIELMLRPTEKS